MWLGEKKIPTKEIHFIEDKWKIDCDVYIDDAPYQLDNYVKNIKNKIIIRFVREYNDPVEGAIDLNEWKNLIPLLNSLNN
jgi:5'(3')-deoxyribonucleotidase